MPGCWLPWPGNRKTLPWPRRGIVAIQAPVPVVAAAQATGGMSGHSRASQTIDPGGVAAPNTAACPRSLTAQPRSVRSTWMSWNPAPLGRPPRTLMTLSLMPNAAQKTASSCSGRRSLSSGEKIRASSAPFHRSLAARSLVRSVRSTPAVVMPPVTTRQLRTDQGSAPHGHGRVGRLSPGQRHAVHHGNLRPSQQLAPRRRRGHYSQSKNPEDRYQAGNGWLVQLGFT